MRNSIICFILLVCTLGVYAQQGINFKAVIRDGAGMILATGPIDITFSLLDGGSTVYTETHASTTDANGIVILNIGEGSPVTGSFASIDWSSNNYFLNVQIDTGSGLQDLGTTAFKTVPYALHAATVKKPTYTVNTFYPELGGYVFEINTDGTHGLVVAMQDQGTASWYTATNLLNNPSNHDFHGAQFRDWRMPSKRELDVLWTNLADSDGNGVNNGASDPNNIGNFSVALYWSGTEDTFNVASLQNLGSGLKNNNNKSSDFISIRGVRAF